MWTHEIISRGFFALCGIASGVCVVTGLLTLQIPAIVIGMGCGTIAFNGLKQELGFSK